MNTKKTKVMVVSKKAAPQISIKAVGQQLEQVKEYKYLGSWITERGDCMTEVKRRIGRAKDNFWEFLRRNLTLNLKKSLLRTYIFSVVGYGSETWTYSKAVIEKLKSFEMWCYRRMLRISWTEKVTNEEVKRRMGIRESMVEEMMRKKMRFAGHMMRGSSGNMARLVIEGSIEEKRQEDKEEHGAMT